MMFHVKPFLFTAIMALALFGALNAHAYDSPVLMPDGTQIWCSDGADGSDVICQ